MRRNTSMITSRNLVGLSTEKKNNPWLKELQTVSFPMIVYTVLSKVLNHYCLRIENYDLVGNMPDSSMYPALLDISIQKYKVQELRKR